MSSSIHSRGTAVTGGLKQYMAIIINPVNMPIVFSIDSACCLDTGPSHCGIPDLTAQNLFNMGNGTPASTPSYTAFYARYHTFDSLVLQAALHAGDVIDPTQARHGLHPHLLPWCRNPPSRQSAYAKYALFCQQTYMESLTAGC